MKTSQCRSCGADIVWCVSPKGKKMPVDAEESDGGKWNIVEGDGDPAAVMKGEDTPGHACHFETCPQADEHRKKPEPRSTGSAAANPKTHATLMAEIAAYRLALGELCDAVRRQGGTEEEFWKRVFEKTARGESVLASYPK